MVDFASIEQFFGKEIPKPYRRYIENYPDELSTANYFGDPDHGGPSDFELLKDWEAIGELNKQEREFWDEADYGETPLPDSYFFIGSDGGGNLFAIDAAINDGCPVFEFDHEEEEWERRANTIEEFAQQLLSKVSELE